MPNACFDAADWIIPAYDPNAKTVTLTVELHPGQVRMLEYILRCGRFPFHDSPQVIRWAVCWAVYTLLAPLPSPFSLIEARMNVLQDENFERQNNCLSDSVSKCIAAGNIEGARRLVTQSHEEYRRIPNEYWRTKWLSTLEPAVKMLSAKGVDLKLAEDRGLAKSADNSIFCPSEGGIMQGGVSLIPDASVTPAMRALAAEEEEFYKICKHIDRLLSENKIVGAQRKLRALIKGILASDSDQTSRYLSEIHDRWGTLVDVGSLLETHLSKSAISEQSIELLRFKFRGDPGALNFISLFEASCKQVDNETSCLGSRLPALISSVDNSSYWVGIIGRKHLHEHLLDAIEARYGDRLDIWRYVWKLRANRRRSADKQAVLPFEERLEGIRYEFRKDKIATDFLFHFTIRIAYIECRLAKDDPAVGRAALMELVRAIVERCSDQAPNLRWQLLGLLSSQYRHVLDVRQEAFRLLDEINLRIEAERTNG